MAGEVEVERLLVRLVGDAADYQRMLRDAQAATVKADKGIAAATRRMAKAVAASLTTAGRAFQKFGRGLQSFGRSLSLRVTAPLTLMGGVAVKSFANFDKAMTESLAIMDVTAEQAERMTQTAIDLGTKGIKGPKALAESYFFLASAGKNAEQSMALLPPLAQFATAGNFDMALATDLLTDAQSALGLSTKNVAQDTENMIRLSDLLVGANTLANASVQQFSTSLTTKAGSAIKSYNIRLEEGIGLLAAYADQGIKAELAGNAVDRVVRLLTKAYAENNAVFKELQVDVFNANGEFNTFEKIIGDIERATEGMSTELKTATLTSLGFEARIQGVILPLLGSSKAIGDYVDQLDEMSGVTDRVANKQLKSFSNQMLILKNQLTAVAIEVGEILSPAIGKMADFVKRGVDAWNSFSDSTKRTIVIIAGVVAVVGPLLIAFGSMISLAGFALTGIALAATWIVAAIAFLVSPLGLALAAIAAVSVAIAALSVAIVAHVASLIGPNGLKAAWNAISFVIGVFVDRALGFLENFRQNLGILTIWFATNWKRMLADVQRASVIFAKNMVDNVKTIVVTGIDLMLDFAKAAERLLLSPFTKENANLIAVDFAVALANSLGKGLGELKTPFEGFESSVEGPVLNFTRRVTEDAIPEDEIAESLGRAVEAAADEIGIVSIPITFTAIEATDVGSFRGLSLQAQAEEFGRKNAPPAQREIVGGLPEMQLREIFADAGLGGPDVATVEDPTALEALQSILDVNTLMLAQGEDLETAGF